MAHGHSNSHIVWKCAMEIINKGVYKEFRLWRAGKAAVSTRPINNKQPLPSWAIHAWAHRIPIAIRQMI